MNRNGPIIIIEDDVDDQEMLREIFTELKAANELIFLASGRIALEYLKDPSVKPFLVISDINLPVMSGFEVRAAIDQHEDVRIRCIPYVFLSTSSSLNTICDAFALSVQGFFTKPASYRELKETIQCILLYWQKGKSPNHV
jgi:CheY-like chemotaxis protein